MKNAIEKKDTIVITSIYHPTEAVRMFSGMTDYRVIVVGDLKTPGDWNCEHVDYLSLQRQEQSGFKLAGMLPFNHYGRKMLGYLHAIKTGTGSIIDIDDDNLPKVAKPDGYHGCRFPGFNDRYPCLAGNMGFVNIYQFFTDQHIWPRGLPLSLATRKFNLEDHLQVTDCHVGVWQGLADEEPDVDAIYRFTQNRNCHFWDRGPLVLAPGTISPFNAQNTKFRNELFALLYLPSHVSFRFTDILRGLVAQPIMWLYGFRLGFTGATVIHKRNQHNSMSDFLSEIPMYQYGPEVVDIVTPALSEDEGINANLFRAYEALFKAGIVCEAELHTFEAWISDLELVQNK